MISSKKQMYTIIGVFAVLLMLTTVTYAFFNYTRTGTANNIRTGRIYFNSTQNGTLNLTNLFPVASNEVGNSNQIEVRIWGDTTYTGGEEFEVSLVSVNNTITSGSTEKIIPVNYIASYVATPVATGETPNNIGTSSNSYFTARGSTTAVYKLNTSGEVTEGEQVLVGYIPANVTIDGTLTIKAYIDRNNIAISDTYDETSPETNYNGTTTSWVAGRTVLTTDEWNSLANTPISFKVRTEANEGTWVEDSNTLYNAVKAMSRGTMNAGTDFGNVASSDTTNHPYGVYQLVESNLSNPVYFFRGDHTVNNNVIFDNKCWLVVRTTETNSTRMIYNGTPVDGHCTTTTGNDTMISLYQSDDVNSDGNYDYSYTSTTGFATLKSGQQFKYNVNRDDAKYVGYTYDNGVNSNIKNALEAWYEGAISSEAKSKIETSTYCNDTRVDSSETSYTKYMPRTRAEANTPSVLCPDGANIVSSKVGFLTVDEEILAGRTYSGGMQDYLFNYGIWYLGSPSHFRNGIASVYHVILDMSSSNPTQVEVDANGLRPVVSILSNIEVIGGDGSQATPWIIS